MSRTKKIRQAIRSRWLRQTDAEIADALTAEFGPVFGRWHRDACTARQVRTIRATMGILRSDGRRQGGAPRVCDMHPDLRAKWGLLVVSRRSWERTF